MEEKEKHLVSFVSSKLIGVEKGRAWRWVCVSLWPIKGFCFVLSTGDSLYCHRLLWQAWFILFSISCGGPWGHRLTCTPSKARQACWLQKTHLGMMGLLLACFCPCLKWDRGKLPYTINVFLKIFELLFCLNLISTCQVKSKPKRA